MIGLEVQTFDVQNMFSHWPLMPTKETFKSMNKAFFVKSIKLNQLLQDNCF